MAGGYGTRAFAEGRRRAPLEEARRAGLLPVYADCEAYLDRLRSASSRAARNGIRGAYPIARSTPSSRE